MSLHQPTRILVLGGGGREHALAWKLAQEPGGNEIVVAPGSAAIAREPRVRCVPVEPLDPEAVVAVARAASVELVVVGPEAPLSVGVADALEAAGIPVFGPTAGGRRARDVEGVLPRGRRGGRGPDGAGAGVRRRRRRRARSRSSSALAADGAGVVLKADGLAAGKGVIVCDSIEQALRARPVVRRGPPGRRAGARDRGAALRAARRASSRSATAPGPSRCPPPATTSGCATATRGRTPAAWAPTRRCPTSTTRRSSACSRPCTGRSSPSSPAAARRSAASSTRA